MKDGSPIAREPTGFILTWEFRLEPNGVRSSTGRIPVGVPDSVNQRWSVDFVSDRLANGWRFRVCNIIDHFSRECVAQITDFSISGERLVRELDQLARIRSLPGTIVLDNGPELTLKAMFFRFRRTGVKL